MKKEPIDVKNFSEIFIKNYDKDRKEFEEGTRGLKPWKIDNSILFD